MDLSSGSGTAVFGQTLSTGDGGRQARATADWINKHGGVAGRKLVVDTYGTPYSAALTDIAGELQRICSRFTEDSKPLFVSLYFGHQTATDCLAKRGVGSVTQVYPLAEAGLKSFPGYVYTPGAMSQDRGLLGATEAALSRGVLKGAKVGLVHSEDPGYRQTSDRVKALLTRNGVAVVKEFGGRADSNQNAASDMASAVLQMQAAGATHLLFSESGALLLGQFMNQAESQGYRPAYVLCSANLLPTLATLAPDGQLARAFALSWLLSDGATTSNLGPLTKEQQLCVDIAKAAGEDTSQATVASSAIIICDQLMFLKKALDAAASPGALSVAAAVGRIGSGFRSAFAYGTLFEPGRYDGAHVTKVMKYVASCDCWQSTGQGPAL